MWTKRLIAAWSAVSFFTLAVVIIFVVIKVQVDKTVTDSSELCSDSAPTFDYFENPPTQDIEVWIYNITNPGSFLNGVEGAELNEFGPYVFDLDVNREDVDFQDGGSKVSFTLFNQLAYNQKDSCVGCGDIYSQKITVMNPVYQAMLTGAASEFNMLLSTTCTPLQVRNMVQSDTAPFCEKSDLSPNQNADCKCCVPAVTIENMTEVDPDGSFAYCEDLVDPYGAKASTISWLASYDGGYKLTDTFTANSFPLSSGLYTPLLRTYTVKEMISGSVSALAGLFNYAAFSSLSDEESIASVEGILTTTQDIKDVCYNTNYDFCPQLSDVMADLAAFGGNQQQVIGYLKNIGCTGSIPNYENLMEIGGLTEERAKELRYLEGVPCAQFAVSIAFAALVDLSANNNAVCADGGAKPCCIGSFSLNSGAQVGKGMGCLRFVDGLLQKRPVFSGEEAEEYLGSTVSHKTSCAGSDRLHIEQWFGEETMTQWFVPQNYQFPNMPWADPIIFNNAGTQVPGTYTTFEVSDGRAVTQMLGTGAGKSFLTQNLNGGNVEQDQFQIFLPGLNRIHTVVHEGNEYFDGVRVAKYYLQAGGNEATAETQGNGQLPYPNMVNMLYAADGIPAILSLVNFVGVDEQIYSQSSNAKRGYPDGVGVTLHRTHESYNRNAPEITPVAMTAETVMGYSEEFASWWEFEPATGLTVTNQISAMFSLFSMNCNPLLDPTCQFAREYSDELCYPTVINNEVVTSPCSNANVFTPKVQGEKVFPMYWNRVGAEPPDDALSAVTILLDVRYAFSILCIVMPGIFVILSAYTIALWRRNADPAVTHEGGRDSMIDMTFRKSAAPTGDRGVSLDEVEENPMQA